MIFKIPFYFRVIRSGCTFRSCFAPPRRPKGGSRSGMAVSQPTPVSYHGKCAGIFFLKLTFEKSEYNLNLFRNIRHRCDVLIAELIGTIAYCAFRSYHCSRRPKGGTGHPEDARR